MGSLPNLHELGKEEEHGESSKPAPALGHLCGGGYQTAMSSEEKSKILHRYSGHCRITKARSNPQDSHKIINDDFMLDHMATYSPISNRSRYNLNAIQGGLIKRRDSMSSSIGTTSVRRLLAVVRGGAQGSGIGRSGSNTVCSQKVLIGNLVVVCLCHLLYTAAFLPFLALQSSMSIWVQPTTSIGTDSITGSALISLVYLCAAGSALLAPCIVAHIGSSIAIAICYGIVAAFFVCHLYPVFYLTIPASILLGFALGTLSSAHITFLMTVAHRLTDRGYEDDEENRQRRKTCVIRRVARAFQGANDFGLITGSILSALLITYTINIRGQNFGTDYDNGTFTINECDNSTSDSQNCSNTTQPVFISTNSYDYNSFLDNIFDRTQDGRLCGAQACPINYGITINTTVNLPFRIIPDKTSEVLIGVYTGACLAAGILALLGLDRLRMLVYEEPLKRGAGLVALKAVKESFLDPKLQLAAPMAVFIGIEQAFIYADFSKSYVVCTLGIHRLNLVFLTMGLLQSIAACTLSMLLRTIRRYYVVAVGFTFHACLIMVLILWKPTEDDPALFYVISASWGVCNAIWEMLNFTLLTGLYADKWEAAFANMAFYKFIGFTIEFIFHVYFCNLFKLYSFAFLMTVAVIPFTWLEIRLETIRKIKNISSL